jgi:type IV fimbrial biogenesis protein FimT
MKKLAITRPHLGFTMIELMITLAMAAVLLGLAVPNLTAFAKNNRLTGGANDLLAAIYSTRAEAIKQQVTATMCFTTTPTAATPACDGNGTQGWITWIDSNGNSTVDAGEEVKVRHDALPASLVLVTRPASTSNLVSFGANGFSRAVANSLSGVVLCDDRKNSVIGGDISAARGLLVEITGRPSVTKSYTTIKTSASLLNGASSGTCVG